MPHREDVRKGQFVVGEAHRAYPRTYDKRDGPSRGDFVTSTPPGVSIAKRRSQPLPPDLAEFESAVAEAERLAAMGFSEAEDRLEQVGQKLDELRAAARQR